jgi:sugar lactone lactonase YvrE
MGMNCEDNAGAIYRYYRGELRRLFDNITISNAICFAPSGETAYFCDTPTRKFMAQALDADGWPNGAPRVHVDLNGAGVNPDGAVVDAAGNLWNAQWGAHRVACYGTDGALLQTVNFAAEQISCPAFGGKDLKTLFATSAADGLDGDAEGQTYSFALTDVVGQAEHQVIL